MVFALKAGNVSAQVSAEVAHVFRHPSRRNDASLSLTRLPRRVQAVAAARPVGVGRSTETPAKPPYEVAEGSLVLVAGANGGVGQLTVQRLLESGFRVRAVVRNLSKARAIFGSDTPNLEIVTCEMRQEQGIPEIMKDVQAVCCCIGTTAFPSPRWKDDNDPEQTDKLAIGNLVKHTPSDIRFVLISSAGVKRTGQLPFSILNLFKVLTYRRMSEKYVMASGLPWTILRPSRLTDAPYTSTDLNTLIRGKRGNRLAVRMSSDDDLYGEASRIDVAEAIVQCLHLPITVHGCYALESIQGDNSPEQDTTKWLNLFSSCDAA